MGGGYSERCYESGHGVTTQSGQEVGIVYDDLTNSNLEYDEYLRPTHQMAMKWLRGKGIFIQIGIIGHSTITVPEDYYFFKVYRDRRFVSYKKTETYHTYEQAVEAALKYSLENLIKKRVKL